MSSSVTEESNVTSPKTASNSQLPSSYLTPLVFAGPSGTGKSTLIGKLMKDFPAAFGFSVSNTTRAPRPGEENGVHYHFSEKSSMAAEIEAGKYIESANIHGNLYGTSYAAFGDVCSQGRRCIFDLDVQGCVSLTSTPLAPRFIFISPPSLDVLRERLTKRGEAPESIEKRLKTAETEMAFFQQHKDMFPVQIVNVDVDVAYAELLNGIKDLLPSTPDGKPTDNPVNANAIEEDTNVLTSPSAAPPVAASL